MKCEDIIRMENNSGCEIHLVRDRLFWQAWENSAFLFSHYIRKYKVRHKFVQKVAKDLVWLGFPDNALKDVVDIAKERNFEVSKIDENHYSITNVVGVLGFEKWKSAIVESSCKEDVERVGKTNKLDYLLFRLVYDFELYVLKLVPKFNKVFKFSLGQRIIDYVMELGECVYMHVNKVSHLYVSNLKLTLHPRKISLQPASKGFDFLGVHILPYRVYAGKRIIKNCRNSVLKNTVDVSEKIKAIAVYLSILMVCLVFFVKRFYVFGYRYFADDWCRSWCPTFYRSLRYRYDFEES